MQSPKDHLAYEESNFDRINVIYIKFSEIVYTNMANNF